VSCIISWELKCGRKVNIFMSQGKYIWNILKKLNMMSYKLITSPLETMLQRNCYSSIVDGTLYHQLVGSLIYLTTNQPYMDFLVHMVLKLCHIPKRYIGK
jgi:hypothetical protein